jgi:hypothetical protein
MRTGSSKPISDAEQRGDQFEGKTAQSVESGQGGDGIAEVGVHLPST